MPVRVHATSGSPYEATIGFSRAVRIDNVVAVSGTAPVNPDGSSACPDDVEGQTRRCLTIIAQALTDVGVPLANVIRTRMYLTDEGDADAVGKVHGEFFGDIKPAATMVVVAKLLRPEWRVEIEADAYASI